MLLLDSLIAYFSRQNYSRRQIILKKLRVWERSLICVPIGVYLGLIGVGTWLGESVMEKGGKLQLKRDWTQGPDSPFAASGQYIRRRCSCWRKDRMMNSVSWASGDNLNPRPVSASWIIGLTGHRFASGHEKLDTYDHSLWLSGPFCTRSNSGAIVSSHFIYASGHNSARTICFKTRLTRGAHPLLSLLTAAVLFAPYVMA